MARIVKEPAIRRKEILDVAQQLIYTKGYDQMSIQDILDALKISKGAFYHYFGSKPALLEALLERMQEEALVILNPIVADPHLPAAEKLQRFFYATARWKIARKEYMLRVAQVWYADENALVRQKVEADQTRYGAMLLTTIIRQGCQEGAFQTPFPDQAGEIILGLLISMGNAFIPLLLTQPPPDIRERTLQLVTAYNDAMERVLGTAPGALHLVDRETLMEWLDTPEEPPRPAEAPERERTPAG